MTEVHRGKPLKTKRDIPRSIEGGLLRDTRSGIELSICKIWGTSEEFVSTALYQVSDVELAKDKAPNAVLYVRRDSPESRTPLETSEGAFLRNADSAFHRSLFDGNFSQGAHLPLSLTGRRIPRWI